MKFQKGNKHGRHGKQPGAGRPTKQQQEVKKLVAEMGRAYIEKNVDPILKAYLQLAGGRKVKHYNQQTGKYIYTEWEVDAPTLRHWIDKLVPAARQEIDIQTHGTVIVKTNVDPYASRRKR